MIIETTKMPADIQELERQVNLIPIEYRGGVAEALSHVKHSALRRNKVLKLIQDSLGQLRLDMKYLTFDLEATRRERDKALGK